MLRNVLFQAEGFGMNNHGRSSKCSKKGENECSKEERDRCEDFHGRIVGRNLLVDEQKDRD